MFTTIDVVFQANGHGTVLFSTRAQALFHAQEDLSSEESFVSGNKCGGEVKNENVYAKHGGIRVQTDTEPSTEKQLGVY